MKMTFKLKPIIIAMMLVTQLYVVHSMQKNTVLISKLPKFHDADQLSAFERLDSKLIKAFAKHYKLDIEYITANDSLNEMFGTEAGFQNLTKAVQSFKIDIFIGALEENLITKKYLIASRPYYHDSLTWCVQRRQPIPRWQTVFYWVTDTNVYPAFTIFAVFAIGFAYFLQTTEPDKKDWHYITLFALTVCIGYPHSYRPKGNPMRALFSIGLFGGIILSTVLTSTLMLRVTIPHFNPQINSITEITNGDFILAGDRFAFQKISQQNEEYSTEVLKKFEIFDDPNIHLRQIEWDNKLAVAVSREQIKNDETLSRMHIYCFESPNHIYEYPMRILTAEKFRYLNELNRFIEMASESGLIGKWLKGMQFGKFGAEKTSFEYSIVGMDILMVLAVIFVALLLFSTYILYVERAMDKRDKNQSNPRIWRMIKKLIDPDRHYFINDLYPYATEKRTI